MTRVDALNMPVEMISLCDDGGKLRPLRFRYQDAAQQMVVVRVEEVVYQKESQQAGLAACLFVCREQLGERQRVFELRYAVREHRWTLFRFLS